MSYVPFLVLLLTAFAQTPTETSKNSPVPQPTPSASSAAQPPAAKAAPAPGQPQAEKPEPETDADRKVKEAAEKIDKLQYVDADVRQVIRAGDEKLLAEGVYKRGPNYHTRLDLKVHLGDTVGERLNIANGKVAYVYERILDAEKLIVLQIDQIIPLLERKELPPGADRMLMQQMMFIQPGSMLRGYLRSVTFTSAKDDILGKTEKRPVVLIDGHWRKQQLGMLTNNPQVTDIESIQGVTPQFLRLYLDKETGWPLKIEMYRRDKTAEFKPVFTFEFTRISFPKTIPEKEFALEPPKKVLPTDLTNALVTQLQSLKDKPGKTSTGRSDSAGAVSEPIAPRGKTSGT